MYVHIRLFMYICIYNYFVAFAWIYHVLYIYHSMHLFLLLLFTYSHIYRFIFVIVYICMYIEILNFILMTGMANTHPSAPQNSRMTSRRNSNDIGNSSNSTRNKNINRTNNNSSSPSDNRFNVQSSPYGNHHNHNLNSVTHAMLELDLRLFVGKVEPDLSVRHTVGGLDKMAADRCWKVINGKGRSLSTYLFQYIYIDECVLLLSIKWLYII